jgi:hypothetical protein
MITTIRNGSEVRESRDVDNNKGSLACLSCLGRSEKGKPQHEPQRGREGSQPVFIRVLLYILYLFSSRLLLIEVNARSFP